MPSSQRKTIIVWCTLAALVAVLVLGFFGFLHYRAAVFTKEILQLKISGPRAAAMADEITYTVYYKNNGNFVLENPKLIFELPEHSLTEDSKNRISTNLKDLNPGDSDSIAFKVRLLGKEGDVKTARATLTYVPRNLSARYESDAVFSTKIEAVPIDLVFDVPTALEKNKETSVTINYLSHVDYPLENLSIKVNSENGFLVSSAVPISLDNTEWHLDVLQKNQGGNILLKGSALGEIGTHFLFSAHVGMWVGGTFVDLKDITQDIQVTQPQVVILHQINGSSNYIANTGDMLNYQVVVQNSGVATITNASVQVKLEGSAFDFSTLQALQGQMQYGHGVLFQIPSLVAGQQMPFVFSIKLKNAITEADKVIKSTVIAAGITQQFTNNVNASPALLQLNVGQ